MNGHADGGRSLVAELLGFKLVKPSCIQTVGGKLAAQLSETLWIPYRVDLPGERHRRLCQPCWSPIGVLSSWLGGRCCGDLLIRRR